MLARKIKLVSDMAIKRPKGWQSLLWNSTMAQLRRPGPLMAPVHVSIEPTNACNARCPVCETGKGDMKRKTGFLDEQLYKEFIDEAAPTTAVLLYYFMGEPFMHRSAYDMIRYARDKGIYVETCTNGDFVDAEGVIFSDVNRVSFQLGGMDQETHGRYRVRTRLDKAVANLERLIALRKKHPESNVEIEVGFIVMRHNEHQVQDFLQWAEKIGIDRASLIDPCARNMLEAHAYLPKDRRYWYYDEEAFAQGILKPKKLPENECVWIWNSIQLNWDGTAVPCCRDPNGKFPLGNVFDGGLKSVFNGEAATDFRRQILSSQGDVSICKLCSGYGLPQLQHPKPAGLTIQRHSVNAPTIPSHEEAIANAQNTLLEQRYDSN
ncbi:MAG: radical SAM/SPASM domain-containing protein [Roseicyclus sp.]|uniref:radical SAM/SPASM domain-containing protein n=1 Tax=Roseicyclus sp. TaxID=1914329 RepID=UPI003A8569FF